MATKFGSKETIKDSGAEMSIEDKLGDYNKIKSAMESQAEADINQWSKRLDGAMERLTPEQINEAAKKAGQSEDEKEHDATQSINFLLQYKVAGDKASFLERMAKSHIFKINDAAQATRNFKGEISFALECLANTADAIARSKFPDNYKQQAINRSEQNKDDLAAARKKLEGFNVS